MLYLLASLLHFIPITFIAIILLPHDIVLTYYFVYKTLLIGPNLKLLPILLLPVPLMLWPGLLCVSSFLFGFFYGFGFPILEPLKTNMIYFVEG